MMKQVLDETGIRTTNLTKMQIDICDSGHVSQRPYPIHMKHYEWVGSEITKFPDAQVIHSSYSSWSISIILMPKGDGRKYLVIDYRALNKVTQKNCVAHAKS